MTDPTFCSDHPEGVAVSAAGAIGRDVQPGFASLFKTTEALGSAFAKSEAMTVLDRIGRDVQPGFASLFKTTEALGSAFAKSEAMTVLDRIGRDVQPGFASLFKTTEALGSAFAKSEAMTVLDRIGRDVQPGFASLFKTTEALGSAFAKSEAMTVLDRIGRDVQPGFASLFKTTEALGSAFAKSEAMTVLDRIGRDVQPGFASLFKTTEALGAVMRTSTKDIGVVAAQCVPSGSAARSQVSDAVLDEPASMPTRDHDIEVVPVEDNTFDHADRLLFLLACMISLNVLLAAAQIVDPEEVIPQTRLWVTVIGDKMLHSAEFNGWLLLFTIVMSLMAVRPRR